jgi:hypothetical protein
MMPKQPIDLDVLRQIDVKIDALLDKYPELREPNSERQQALEDWLQNYTQEETDDATPEDR